MSVYCFVSSGNIHCVPVSSFLEYSNPSATPPTITIDGAIDNTLAIDDDDDSPNDSDKKSYLKIKHKNLLYTLNNPTLSDIESDAGESAQNGNSSYLTGIIDNYGAHALYLPDFSINLPDTLSDNYTQIKELLMKVFSKTWTEMDLIEVKRLTGGITNMLLKCSYGQEIVLMRVYGPGTNLIIDRHREFISHLVLNSMDLAPPVHARFKNGLIYGFLDGRSLEPNELKNTNLFPLIAQQLGNWHTKVDIESINSGVTKLRDYTKAHKRRKSIEARPREDYIPKKERKHKKKSISNIWDLIEDWIDVVPVIPELVESFSENTPGVTADNIKDIIKQEFFWLHSTLSQISSPTISSHCDLLSGNIIIPNEEILDKKFHSLPDLPQNPIKFIDYEYMLPAPRAFDIANHLAEWQGFDCDRSAIPEPSVNNPVMVKWVKSYLNNENASEHEVKSLIDEISGYYGLPGFYWGIWAVIQSEISNIDFNYSNYAKLRLQEYWDWKRLYVSEKKVKS